MKFVANDGKVFERQEDCLEYEMNITKEKLQKDIIVLDYRNERIDIPLNEYGGVKWNNVANIMFKTFEAIKWFEYNFNTIIVRNHAMGTTEINRPLHHCYNGELEYIDEQIEWLNRSIERNNDALEAFKKIG